MAAKLLGVRIDIETKSGEDLKKSGVYRYTEHPEFEVLIIRYAPLRKVAGGKVAMGKVRTLNLDDTEKCMRFRAILQDPRFQKHAYNAAFERIALSAWIARPPLAGLPRGVYLDPENWHCSAVRANVSGVFGSLDDVAKAVNSPITKDPEGKRLIRLFSIPDKKTGQFHSPRSSQCWCGGDHWADWLKYGDYCTTDVLTEAGVAAQLPPIPADVQKQYEDDQRINDRGFRHFGGLSRAAVAQVEVEKNRLMGELKTLTGLENPNSIQQMRGWLERMQYPMESLNAEARTEALADPLCPPDVARALTLKGSASLSSVAKHTAALATRCRDGRIRGSLQFYGAHTGREAGRGIQPQNLPRYEAPASDRARLLLGKAGQDAPTIAKGTVRASIVPAKNTVFVVFDYNAIEARCLGWQAGETWVMDEFHKGQGKIYEATASTMFGVLKDQLIADLAKCGKCGKDTCIACGLRNKGKVSNLALGYAGGAGALVTMGAESAGIDVGNYVDLNKEWLRSGSTQKFHEWEQDRHDYPELKRLRDLYRDASPQTVRFWKQCGAVWDNAAVQGIESRFGPNDSIVMRRDGKHNRLILPSGRSIWYRFARSHKSDRNPDRIDRRTFIGKAAGVGHRRTDTHGGKLTENITQAVARDVLFDLIGKIEAMTKKGWPGRIVLHVHDEVVLEVPEKHAAQVLADVDGLMAVAPDWAPGLPVKGAGGIMERYGK